MHTKNKLDFVSQKYSFHLNEFDSPDLQRLLLILFWLWVKIHIGKEQSMNLGQKYLRREKDCLGRLSWQSIGNILIEGLLLTKEYKRS